MGIFIKVCDISNNLLIFSFTKKRLQALCSLIQSSVDESNQLLGSFEVRITNRQIKFRRIA